MYEDMLCMHRILYVGKNSEPLIIITTLVLTLVEKTNDNLDMVEYVADADECDQQPYEERDKATSLG